MDQSKMDHIFINEVPFYANHGVFAEEKSLGQTFLLSLKLFIPMVLPLRRPSLLL